MNNNKSFLFVFLLFVCFFLPSYVSSAVSAPTPTLIDVYYDQTYSAPLVTGLSVENTEVLIYVDGKYSGLANINTDGTSTNNFVFYILEDLEEGVHQITSIARDKTSLLLSTPSAPLEYIVEPLPAPTLLAPNEMTITSNVRPLITGLSKSNTIVHLVIDGVVNGNTGLIKHESGTANFAYKPFLNLSVGAHQVYAIAEAQDGRKSQASAMLEFKIEEPMVSPTVFKPLNTAFPVINGLSINDSLVKVYVDHRVDGQFEINNNESGVANFSYKVNKDLSVGEHIIYLTASDKRGKESPWSEIFYHHNLSPKIAAGVDEVVVLSNEAVFGTNLEDLLLLARLYREDKTVSVADYQVKALEGLINKKEDLGLGIDAMSDLENLWEAKRPKVEMTVDDTVKDIIKENIADNDEEPIKTVDIKDLVEATTTGSMDSDISEFLGEIEEEEARAGLINEDKEKQSNLKWNIAIFILFLIAVILWIFWVNRELIKEQQEQDEKDNSK